MRAALDGTIPVYGDGEQIMDMVHVEDVARVLVAALLWTDDHGGSPTIFDAGTGHDITVLDIADTIAELVSTRTGRPVGIDHLPMRPGETPGVVVKADPATLAPLAEYGIRPDAMTPMRAGMIQTVDWYLSTYAPGQATTSA
jgi:UDP-glucose 4-epimerase